MLFNQKLRILRILWVGFFFATFLGFFWCAYRNSNLKGLERFSKAIKIAGIATWIWLNTVLGLPLGASAKKNDPSFGVDGFQPPISRPLPKHYGHFGQDPKKDPSFDSDLDSDKNILKNKKDTLHEHPSHYYEKLSKDNDEETCSEGSTRIVSGVAQDGTIVEVEAKQMRDKSHHMDDFIDSNEIKGKFDIDYARSLDYQDRLDYVRDPKNLPDELVHKMQDEVLEFLTHPKTILVPGFVGKTKVEGTLFINLELNKVGFRNYSDFRCRTAMSMTDQKIKRLADNNFHLFPDN